MEMKLQPHSIQRFPSTVADCSQSTCAGRCIDRSGNMGVWCLPASPKTIWVSPTGSDELNDGISAPLATIQRGIHYASDGDTVELMPGIYTGGRIVPPSTTPMDFTGRRSAAATITTTSWARRSRWTGMGVRPWTVKRPPSAISQSAGSSLPMGETETAC